VSALSSIDVPQANNVGLVEILLAGLQAGVCDRHELAHMLQVDERQVDYYSHAARILGFARRADGRWTLSEQGLRFLQLREPEQRRNMLREAFERSPVARALSAFGDLREMTREDIARALAQSAELSPATARRRADTVVRWCQALGIHPRPPARTAHGYAAQPALEFDGAAAPAGAAEEPRAPGPTVEPTASLDELSHLAVHAQLVEMGKLLGCDVAVARNDRHKIINGRRLGEGTVDRLPALALGPEAMRIIEMIDCLWLRRANIVAAFEIEHTTSIYSGLLRMSDLLILVPNLRVDLFIVAPDERRELVRREVRRPTFDALQPPLAEVCRFIPYSSLQRHLTTVRQLAPHIGPDSLKAFAEPSAG